MEAPQAPELQEHRGGVVSEGRVGTHAHGCGRDSWDPQLLVSRLMR